MKKIALLFFVFFLSVFFKPGSVFAAVDCLTVEAEPNDTLAQADLNLSLCPGTGANGVLPVTSDEARADSRKDYYKINVVGTGPISISLVHPSASDFDLFLYREGSAEGGVALASSENRRTSLSETINVDVDPGKYFILVYNYMGGSTEPYSIFWNYGKPPPPPPVGACNEVGGPCGTGFSGTSLGVCCGGLICKGSMNPDQGGTCVKPETVIWSNYIELLVTNNTDRPPYCASSKISNADVFSDSIGGSVPVLEPAKSIMINSSSKVPVAKFNYTFFNRDNLNSDGIPNVISFEQKDGKNLPFSQVGVVKDGLSKENYTNVIYDELDRVDLNTGKKPKNIQVNAYFVDSQGKVSAPDAACVTKFIVLQQTVSCNNQGGPCGTGFAGKPLGTCCGGLRCQISTNPDQGGTCVQNSCVPVGAGCVVTQGGPNGIASTSDAVCCAGSTCVLEGANGTSSFGHCQPSPNPSCTQRPACLDFNPPCLPPEPAEGWCPSSFLTMIVKFPGISTNVGPIPVNVIVNNPSPIKGETSFVTTAIFKFNDNGYYKAGIYVPVLRTGARTVLLKGPSHLQARFNSVPFVVNENTMLDTTMPPYQRVMTPGDVVQVLPDPTRPGATMSQSGQDGKLSIEDISAVVSTLSRAQTLNVPYDCADPEASVKGYSGKIKREDINRDCKISMEDVSLIVNTIRTAGTLEVYDEN